MASDFKSVVLSLIDSFQVFFPFGKNARNGNAIVVVNTMKDIYKSDQYLTEKEVAMAIDDLKIVQTILSKQMPPEQYNGILNFRYMHINPNTTSEEIDNALVMRVKLENAHL